MRLKGILESILNEGSDKTFHLNPSQYDALDKIISNFGGDIDSLTETVNEAPKPDYTKMTAADMEREGYVIAVDKGVLNNLEGFLEEIGRAHV